MTTAAPSERLLTAAEYAATPDDRRTELVNGRIVEIPRPGFLHGIAQVKIASALADIVRTRDAGHVLIGTGIVTTRAPDTVRGADVSFYSYDRVPKRQVPEGYATIAPEVVFEIRSPEDRTGEVLRKVSEYLNAGTLLVGVIDPRRRNAVLFRDQADPAVFSETDTLRFPSPLEDWTPRIAEFFAE